MVPKVIVGQGPEDVSNYGRVRHPPPEDSISPAQAKQFNKLLKAVPTFVDPAKVPADAKRVKRKQGPPWPDRKPSSSDADDADEAAELGDLSFTFPMKGSLGLRFSDEGNQVTVHQITDSGLAAPHVQAGLRPGLVLKSVGSRSVLSLSFDEAIKLISSTRRPLTLTFEQPLVDKSGSLFIWHCTLLQCVLSRRS